MRSANMSMSMASDVVAQLRTGALICKRGSTEANRAVRLASSPVEALTGSDWIADHVADFARDGRPWVYETGGFNERYKRIDAVEWLMQNGGRCKIYNPPEGMFDHGLFVEFANSQLGKRYQSLIDFCLIPFGLAKKCGKRVSCSEASTRNRNHSAMVKQWLKTTARAPDNVTPEHLQDNAELCFELVWDCGAMI